MEELRRATGDQFSFSEAVRDVSGDCFFLCETAYDDFYQQRISADYTLGKEIHANPYHIPIIRSQLTRNIGVLSSEIRDEIITAFDEVLDLKYDGEELLH